MIRTAIAVFVGENESGVTDAAETLHPRNQSPDFGLGIVSFDHDPLEVEVELCSDGWGLLDTVPLNLSAGGTVVVTDIYRRVTLSDMGDGCAIIDAVDGGGGWYIFGSLVDNLTGEAAAIPTS